MMNPENMRGLSLDQLRALKMQQHAQKAQIVLNTSVQFLCHKVVQDVDQALILAEQLVLKWERKYSSEAENQNNLRKDT